MVVPDWPRYLARRTDPERSRESKFCPARATIGVPMRPHINPFEKRRKEFARKERQKKKAERREIRDREKADRPAGNAEEDPDIAGIVPGPQPPLESE